ncbi:hypothetical protein OPV22_034561 [Ensete ventricosum]|uniref:Uncharacterized protein n=1 Tax=Ensete ventricosum TaxID=4639 RepID=A0AAV8P389_ENSVE|nr:hypothetical protein OPV22_034561 [Ensete ventricosum]
MVIGNTEQFAFCNAAESLAPPASLPTERTKHIEKNDERQEGNNLQAKAERFDQDSVMPDIGKEATVKIEPHEAFSRVRCDAEIVGDS